MKEFVESFSVDYFLMICVFANTIILGMDGLVDSATEDVFVTLNLVFTIIFGVEMVFKLYGLGLSAYCNDYFNVFDGFVVILSFVEIIITSASSNNTQETTAVVVSPTEIDEVAEEEKSGTSAISAFRAIRIFRIFRVLRVTRLLRG